MHPGEIVAGKYRVANILGRSRGLLLDAHHTEFDQHVIIRLLSTALCNEKEVEQFRREAKTLAKLDSEHVARIIDVGTHSDGSFFLVRQYLEGVDLATHIRNQGALRLEEAVLYILQTAEAVTECHHHNIILRELQPSHVFLTSKRGGAPLVKLIDFGTAKLIKDPIGEVVNGEMTATVMFGMSPYSSPELVRKVKGIDGRTDVWSLGCILYEMLAAVSPFQGEMAELMLKITREDPVPLSSLRPDLPREFDQIIGWSLAKDRDSRFKSVYAFAHALKPFATAEGTVLIDQIGRLQHAQKSQSGGAAMSPTSPLAKRSKPDAYEDDDATVIRQVPADLRVSDENPFEKTTFLPDAENLDRGSVPPPPPPGSQPSFGSNDRGSVPPPRARQGSWIEPDPIATSGLSANATGGYPAQTATGASHKQRQRKMAVVAIGAALVLLPVLVVVLIFALREGPPEPVASLDPGAAATGVPATGNVGATQDSGEPEPETDSSAEPETSAEPDDDDAPPSSTAAGAQTSKAPWNKGKGSNIGSAPPEPEPPSSKKKKKKKKKKSPAASGTGTLVAIAIGGSCSFAVDGAPRGTKSSIRIKVPVGPHTVSCTPPGGASRTQRVNVKSGKPGIASFRLN
jgi:serine/threonine protein kinase